MTTDRASFAVVMLMICTATFPTQRLEATSLRREPRPPRVRCVPVPSKSVPGRWVF